MHKQQKWTYTHQKENKESQVWVARAFNLSPCRAEARGSLEYQATKDTVRSCLNNSYYCYYQSIRIFPVFWSPLRFPKVIGGNDWEQAKFTCYGWVSLGKSEPRLPHL